MKKLLIVPALLAYLSGCMPIGIVYTGIKMPNQVTDNEVGCAFVVNTLGIAAANALTSPSKLFDLVYKEVFPNGN